MLKLSLNLDGNCWMNLGRYKNVECTNEEIMDGEESRGMEGRQFKEVAIK